MKKNLYKEFLVIQKLKENLGEEFLFGRKYKKEREFWILASMFNLLDDNNQLLNEYIFEQESPDFKVFNDSNKKIFNLEVCEIFHPERRRGDERKNPFYDTPFLQNLIIPQIDIWAQFKFTLLKKLSKDYGQKSWLLIYHNIPISHITKYGFWINIVCSNVKKWIEQKKINFFNIKYEKILVINSSFNELISIYPSFLVIYSKNKQYFIY